MCRRSLLLSIVLLLLASASARAGDSAELDLRTWQRIPVLDRGRLMPLDSFARSVVRQVCGQARPTLDPSGIPKGSSAWQLFPGGGPRGFDAAELLLSWTVEPEKWEQAPLLIAAGRQLREDLLGLPLRSEEGRRLEHVSVRQLLEADRFWLQLEDIRQRERIARAQGMKLGLRGLDAEVADLWEAYTLYRLVTFDPAAPVGGRGRLLDKLVDVVHTWRNLQGDLDVWLQWAERYGSETLIEDLGEAIAGLAPLIEQGELPIEDAEPLLLELARSADTLAEHTREIRRAVFRDVSADDWQRAAANRLVGDTGKLARVAGQMHAALYDDGRSLRLVPALDPGALRADRDLDDDSQPWLSLQTLLLGSPALLADYPQDELGRFREAFGRVKAAYLDRGAADRPKRFAAAMEELADAVRALGEAVEPSRRLLAIPGEAADVEDMLAATAYPPEGRTDVELYYNRAAPFFWLWVVYLVSAACFGVWLLSARRTVFWCGVLTLTLALVLIVYGLALRTIITAWVSVTNVFEVIMFVALTAGVLGLWLALLPLLRPGISRAWQMTTVNWFVLVPRLALAAVVFVVLALKPYGSGGARAIISLLPRVDLGARLPSANGVLCWAAGWCVLLLAVWWLPRLILAATVSLYTVPADSRSTRWRQNLDEVYRQGWSTAIAAAIGLVASLLAYFLPVFDKDIRPLMPVLRDNFWLTVHVLSITASYGAAALAWGLGNVALGCYLFGRYRDPVDPPAGAISRRRPPEACAVLAGSIHKSIQVTVLLLAVGTVLGALWGDVAWGRFWAWDAKEVWALISLLVYLAILHSRCRGWSGEFGMALASLLGATSIVIAWYGVNYLLRSGLHTYAGGAGGEWYVGGVVVGEWLLLVFAAIRYWMERTG